MRRTMENKIIKKDHWVVEALDELYDQIIAGLMPIMDPIYSDAARLREDVGPNWDEGAPHVGGPIDDEETLYDEWEDLCNSIVEYYRKTEGWK